MGKPTPVASGASQQRSKLQAQLPSWEQAISSGRRYRRQPDGTPYLPRHFVFFGREVRLKLVDRPLRDSGGKYVARVNEGSITISRAWGEKWLAAAVAWATARWIELYVHQVAVVQSQPIAFTEAAPFSMGSLPPCQAREAA